MKHLAKYVADCYREKNIMPSTTIDCMEYTMQALLNEISKCLLYGVLFAFFHLLPDYLFACSVFISLRWFAGGIHCKTYWGCFVVSLFMLGFCILMPRFFMGNLDVMIAVSTVSIICPLILSPVTPSFRIIKKKQDRIKLRVLAVILSLFWIAVAALFIKELTNALIILYTVAMVNYQLPIAKAMSGRNTTTTDML